MPNREIINPVTNPRGFVIRVKTDPAATLDIKPLDTKLRYEEQREESRDCSFADRRFEVWVGIYSIEE